MALPWAIVWPRTELRRSRLAGRGFFCTEPSPKVFFADYIAAGFSRIAAATISPPSCTLLNEDSYGKGGYSLRRLGVEGLARMLLPLQVRDGAVIEEQICGRDASDSFPRNHAQIRMSFFAPDCSSDLSYRRSPEVLPLVRASTLNVAMPSLSFSARENADHVR